MAVITKDAKQFDVWQKKFNLLKVWKLENADEPCRDTSLGKWLHGQRKIFRRCLGGKRNKKVVLNRNTKITLFKQIGIDIQLPKPTKTTRVLSKYKSWSSNFRRSAERACCALSADEWGLCLYTNSTIFPFVRPHP